MIHISSSLCFVYKDLIPSYIGKMHINSLNDLTRIATSGSKQTAVDELNDFVQHGKLSLHSRLYA